jgi:hypothetical protein
VNLISRKNESRPAARAIIELLFEEAASRNYALRLAQTENDTALAS